MKQIGNSGWERQAITADQFRALAQRSKLFQQTMLRFLKPD